MNYNCYICSSTPIGLMEFSICNMYSSFECYKVVFTQVLGSSMAQQNMENKEQNQISTKA